MFEIKISFEEALQLLRKFDLDSYNIILDVIKAFNTDSINKLDRLTTNERQLGVLRKYVDRFGLIEFNEAVIISLNNLD